MKTFTPMGLTEGVEVDTLMSTLRGLDEVLAFHLGKDTEAKTVVVSFLLGRLARNSKIGADMVLGMVESSRMA